MRRYGRSPGGSCRTRRMKKKRMHWLGKNGIHNGMKLYHGTTFDDLVIIKNEGLMPRGERPSRWEGLEESHSEMVYLTEAHPYFFGAQGGHPITVAVEVDVSKLDPRRLHADEDFIVQMGLISANPGETLHTSARNAMLSYQSFWRASLSGLGTCAYHGRIPATAITRFCIFERSINLRLAMRWTIKDFDVHTYRAVREGLVLGNKLMFGDIGELPEDWVENLRENPEAMQGVTAENNPRYSP